MKQKLNLLIFIFVILASCKNDKISPSYKLLNYYNIYAYNMENKQIELISIEDGFEENYFVDDFIYLYINYPNYLPKGYTTFITSNVYLDKIKTIKNIKYYYFTDTELEDLIKLYKLVQSNNNLKSMTTIFILNNKVLF